MKKYWLMSVLPSVIAAILGWLLIFGFGIEPTQAEVVYPPFVIHVSSEITISTIPTPTFPTGLNLVAPAFVVDSSIHPITLTVNTTTFEGDMNRLHLVYRDQQFPEVAL